MDKLDRRILDFLRSDARRPFVKIAQDLGVSEGTVRMRVKKLEEEGIIQRYTILTEDKSSVQAIVSVKTSASAQTKKIAKRISEISKSSFTFELMGEFDILTLVNAENTSDLDNQIEAIRKIDGVTNTISALILKKYI